MFFFGCGESRGLGPEHGFKACSFKNKRKKLYFHEKVGFWGVKKPKSWICGGQKTNKKTKTWNEICQLLVSRALDDTKTIGKVGADIFAKSGPEKPKKSEKNQNVLRDFPRFSRGFSLKPLNSRRNGWEPNPI